MPLSHCVKQAIDASRRYKFLDALVPLLPNGVAHFKKRCIGISQPIVGDAYTVHFQDGSTASANVVVGADGIKSIVRKFVIEGLVKSAEFLLGEEARQGYEGALSFTGTKVYRAVIPMDILKKAGMQLDIDQDAINFYLGEHKVFVLKYSFTFGF